MAESLLSEVTPLLPYYHVFKSGEQLYFGYPTVYTNLETEFRFEKKDCTSKNKNESKPENLQQKLKAGIQAIKNVVQDALSYDNYQSEPTSSKLLLNLQKEVSQIKSENQQLRKEIDDIRKILSKMNCSDNSTKNQVEKNKTVSSSNKNNDDDFDLFDSDSDEEESDKQKQIREERLAAYAEKKAAKPTLIAKSSVILDIKPWDDETDLVEMERLVRSIQKDGLHWGAAKLIPIGYGIKKLQIVSIIEDEKISVDEDLVERIQDDFSDYVQSVDIVAFNKI